MSASPAPGGPDAFAAEAARELADLERAGLLRELPPAGAPRGADFASNDYLGLARRPELAEAAARAARDHGAGGRAARLLAGGSPEHEALERAAAEWVGAEASLLFPSGYQANLGLVGALAGRGDLVFTDELVHASLVDAARLSRARVHVFRHGDVDELERLLARAASAPGRRLVLVESVYSMDGDLAPLAELDRACERHGAWLAVDEAHALGLLGPGGAGACAGIPLARLVARTLAGGKSLGVAGALVAGSRALVQLVLNRARAFAFTTAPSPAVAGALRAAVELARGAEAERARTLALARRVAQELGLPAPGAAIVPFQPAPSAGPPAESGEPPAPSAEPTGASATPTGAGATPTGATGAPDALRALALSAELARAGLDVRAVRPPTVPAGTSRLRVVCHAHNADSEVDELVRRLAPCAPPLGAGRSAGRGAGAPRVARGRAEVLFVAGTDTGVGKTVVSALLVRAALRAGPARYWKPVQTGTESDTAAVAYLAGLRQERALRPAFRFPLPASPHEAARAAGTAIPRGALAASLAGLRRTLPDERLVVELAGGLLVPLDDGGHTQLDWLAAERAPLVLVARSGLGTLNHTLLSLEALRARHLEPRALFLVGPEHPSNRETLRRLGAVEVVLEVPELSPLDERAVDGWIEGASADRLVELFR